MIIDSFICRQCLIVWRPSASAWVFRVRVVWKRVGRLFQNSAKWERYWRRNTTMPHRFASATETGAKYDHSSVKQRQLNEKSFKEIWCILKPRQTTAIKIGLWAFLERRRECAKWIRWEPTTAALCAANEATIQCIPQSRDDAGVTLTGAAMCCVTSAWRTRGWRSANNNARTSTPWHKVLVSIIIFIAIPMWTKCVSHVALVYRGCWNTSWKDFLTYQDSFLSCCAYILYLKDWAGGLKDRTRNTFTFSESLLDYIYMCTIFFVDRLQNSPYFSARVGLNAARKGSGTSVKITSGIGGKRWKYSFLASCEARARIIGASRLSIHASCTISWEKERLFRSLSRWSPGEIVEK